MNQVYAIRYAHRGDSIKGEHFYRHIDDCAVGYPIDYFTWVVVPVEGSPGDTVAFDAGFTAETAARRNREYLASPIETMSALGIDATTVGHLVLSHLHYDHTGHLADFPAAEIMVQRSEIAYWTGPYASRHDGPHLVEGDDITTVIAENRSGRIRQIDGDVSVTAGVSAHLVGGHTAGLQVLRVETEAGPVVLCSDASHFYDNIENDHPYSIIHTLPDMFAAFDRIKELAGPDGIIVPGHDPKVVDRFPTVPGLEGLAVRIA